MIRVDINYKIRICLIATLVYSMSLDETVDAEHTWMSSSLRWSSSSTIKFNKRE